MQNTNANKEVQIVVRNSPSSMDISNHNEVVNHVTTEMTYVEWAENPIQESHLLEQLQKNMAKLEELQARHSFLMREVRYLLKV